eukprot:6464481-Pyramimonas_sp.AAC.1
MILSRQRRRQTVQKLGLATSIAGLASIEAPPQGPGTYQGTIEPWQQNRGSRTRAPLWKASGHIWRYPKPGTPQGAKPKQEEQESTPTELGLFLTLVPTVLQETDDCELGP